MSFCYHQFDKGQTPPLEYIKGKAGEVFAVGEALVVGADGTLTKCAATAVPAYIGMGPVDGRGEVPCSRVHRDIVYAVPLSAAGAALKLGDKVTIGADALTVTATTASGVAEIVAVEGTSPGDAVRVRF